MALREQAAARVPACSRVLPAGRLGFTNRIARAIEYFNGCKQYCISSSVFIKFDFRTGLPVYGLPAGQGVMVVEGLTSQP